MQPTSQPSVSDTLHSLPTSNEQIQVKIIDPKKVHYEGEVESITSYNNQGIFDILPLHTNYITLITNKVILRKQNETTEYPLYKGILRCEQNRVEIYLIPHQSTSPTTDPNESKTIHSESQ